MKGPPPLHNSRDVTAQNTWTLLSHHNPLGQVCEPCLKDVQTDQGHTAEDGIWVQCQAPRGPHSTLLSPTGTSHYKGIPFKGTSWLKRGELSQREEQHNPTWDGNSRDDRVAQLPTMSSFSR